MDAAELGSWGQFLDGMLPAVVTDQHEEIGLVSEQVPQRCDATGAPGHWRGALVKHESPQTSGGWSSLAST